MCYFLRQRRFLHLLIVLMGVLLFSDKVASTQKVVNIGKRTCGPLCKDPQPRAARVADLANTTDIVTPYMMIIHRCDEGSGCCKARGSICTVKDSEVVQIQVYMFENRTYRLNTYTVTNHTECSCQDPH